MVILGLGKAAVSVSDMISLDLVEQNIVMDMIIELRGARRHIPGDSRRDLKIANVPEILRNHRPPGLHQPLTVRLPTERTGTRRSASAAQRSSGRESFRPHAHRARIPPRGSRAREACRWADLSIRSPDARSCWYRPGPRSCLPAHTSPRHPATDARNGAGQNPEGCATGRGGRHRA